MLPIHHLGELLSYAFDSKEIYNEFHFHIFTSNIITLQNAINYLWQKINNNKKTKCMQLKLVFSNHGTCRRTSCSLTTNNDCWHQKETNEIEKGCQEFVKTKKYLFYFDSDNMQKAKR